jgi:hypothetical protein
MFFVRIPVRISAPQPRQQPKTQQPYVPAKTSRLLAVVSSVIVMTVMIALGAVCSSVGAPASGMVMAVFIIVGLAISISMLANSEGKKKPPKPPVKRTVPIKGKPGPRDWDAPPMPVTSPVEYRQADRS